MARHLSWLLRLDEIRATVEKSSRSHWDREEIEFLFDLRPSAAGKLMAALPTERLGRSLLVTRETLQRFLAEAAADPKARPQRARKSRAKPKLLVRRALVEESRMNNLPAAVTVTPGKIKVFFNSKAELLEGLARLMGAMENDFDAFSSQAFLESDFDEKKKAEMRATASDVRKMFEELRQMEANRNKRVS